MDNEDRDEGDALQNAYDAALTALRALADLAFHEGDVLLAKTALDAVEAVQAAAR